MTASAGSGSNGRTEPTRPTPLDSSITPLIAAMTFGGRLFGRDHCQFQTYGSGTEERIRAISHRLTCCL